MDVYGCLWMLVDVYWCLWMFIDVYLPVQWYSFQICYGTWMDTFGPWIHGWWMMCFKLKVGVQHSSAEFVASVEIHRFLNLKPRLVNLRDLGNNELWSIPGLVNIHSLRTWSHGHWNSRFNHKKWWFSIVLWLFTRGYQKEEWAYHQQKFCLRIKLFSFF